MSSTINFEQKLIIGKDRDSAAQTALSGNTVYSLPKWTARRNMVDLVLMIMDEDGPIPMYNMRPTKKMRNAADQFDDEHQGEYEARGQPPHGQIERVHTHNNAYPKMYDELDKRRSIAQVGMAGIDTHQFALRGTTTYSSNQNIGASKFDPNCPKCLRRKKRLEDERKKKGKICKKCKNKRIKKESSNKLDRVLKRSPRPRKQQSRCRSTFRSSKPCLSCSNKCFQCYITTESKSVSTFKSTENLLATSIPEIVPTNYKENNDKVILDNKTTQKKKIGKKQSIKSDGNPDTETRPSVSSYNSYMSMEHEPMIE